MRGLFTDRKEKKKHFFKLLRTTLADQKESSFKKM